MTRKESPLSLSPLSRLCFERKVTVLPFLCLSILCVKEHFIIQQHSLLYPDSAMSGGPDPPEHPLWVSSDAIRKNDVLLGRGSGPNSRPGNRLFRKLLQQRKEEYNSTKNRLTKDKIAKEILCDIETKHNTRFLRKATVEDSFLFGIPNDVDAWCIVDEGSVLEKVKQGLRQKAEWKDVDINYEEEMSSLSEGSSERLQQSSLGVNLSASVEVAPRELTHQRPPLSEEEVLMSLPLPPDDHVSSDLPPPEPHQGPIVPHEWKSNENHDLEC